MDKRTPSASGFVEVNLGQNVRELRKARGWSQEEMARQMGNQGHELHQTTIAKLENAGRPTTAGELVALSRIFHVSVGRLLATPKSGVPRDIDEEKMAALQAAMAAVRETYGQMRALVAQQEEIDKQFKDLKREHHTRVVAYKAARWAAGPNSPVLPAYIEAGMRRSRESRRRANLAELKRMPRPIPKDGDDGEGER